MKRMLWTLCAGLALACLPAASNADEKEEHAHEEGHGEIKEYQATLTGVPLDLACYLDGHSGPGMKDTCSKNCILTRGLPAGFMVEENGKKTIYIVMGADVKELYGKIGPYVNKKAKVTANVIERENLKTIDIKKIEPVTEEAKKE